MSKVLAAATPVDVGLKSICVGSKTNGGMGSPSRAQHELVFVSKTGNAAAH
jgi:hypothetical protein